MTGRIAGSGRHWGCGVLVAALLAAPPGQVAADNDHERALRLLESGEILPLETIIEQAKSVQAGTVIEAEIEREHDRLVYEIELVDDEGIVHEMLIDAATGEVLGVERED